MSTAFGAVLKRLRLASGYSQNGLARAAGFDPAFVNQLEHGHRRQPSRGGVERFAAALGAAELDTARLLVAAGYWPWPELSPEDTMVAIHVLLAIRAGDVRRLLEGGAAPRISAAPTSPLERVVP